MREMGSASHLLCPRYSGTLTLLPFELLGYGNLYLFVNIQDGHLMFLFFVFLIKEFLFKRFFSLTKNILVTL